MKTLTQCINNFVEQGFSIEKAVELAEKDFNSDPNNGLLGEWNKAFSLETLDWKEIEKLIFKSEDLFKTYSGKIIITRLLSNHLAKLSSNPSKNYDEIMIVVKSLPKVYKGDLISVLFSLLSHESHMSRLFDLIDIEDIRVSERKEGSYERTLFLVKRCPDNPGRFVTGEVLPMLALADSGVPVTLTANLIYYMSNCKSNTAVKGVFDLVTQESKDSLYISSSKQEVRLNVGNTFVLCEDLSDYFKSLLNTEGFTFPKT